MGPTEDNKNYSKISNFAGFEIIAVLKNCNTVMTVKIHGGLNGGRTSLTYSKSEAEDLGAIFEIVALHHVLF